MPTPRAALYARLSRRSDANEPGLDAQLHELRALAGERGWQVVTEIAEHGSAFDNEGGRDGFAELIGLVRSGEVEVVVARHPDRFSRDEVESAIFRRDCHEHGVLISSMHGDVDLDSASDELLATITSGIARYESRLKRERLLSKHADLARRGQISGGGWRPFGYLENRLDLDPEESATLAEVVRRLLAGASMASEVTRLNEAGVTTTTGAAWRRESLRRLVCSARIAGLREHDGKRYPAVWPGIISADELDRVRAIVEARALPRRKSRRYLLTGGIAVCGRCETALVARPRGDGRRAYVCSTQHDGCGKIGALAESLEAEVAGQIIAAIDSPALADLLDRDDADDTLSRLRELDDFSSSLASSMIAGALRRSDYDEHVETIAAERKRLEALLDAASDPLAGIETGALAEIWSSLELDRQRAIIRLVAEEVVISPAVKGRTKFDPDRISITWRS